MAAEVDPRAIERFLGLLFPQGSQGFTEIRAIAADGAGAKRTFIPLPELRDTAKVVGAWQGTRNVFVGVAARTREAGTKDAVGPVHVAWVDIDDAGAGDSLKQFEPAPTLIVASGTPGHLHAYWALSDAVEPSAIEEINRALAERLGGDPAVVDAARVMRVPGTLNFKHDPPAEAQIVSSSGTTYLAGELRGALGLDEAADKSGGPTAKGAQAGEASEPVRKVMDHLEGVKPTATGWTALCPAHDDHNPSLSVAEGEDGRCLIHCFAGCSADDVVAELGLRIEDLFPDTAQGRKTSTRLIDLAERTGIDVFRTPGGVSFASVRVDDHRESWPLESTGFASWLRRLHYKATGEALRDDGLSEAVSTFAAKAQFEGVERELYRRVAGDSERIVIDLGDEHWRAIEVTADGWEIVEDPGVSFLRDASMLALPEPVSGGSIEELRDFTNCANEASWLRLCGFLVMCFNPSGPYPVGYPTGEQGSAKSTLSRLIFLLVDPRIAPLMMGNPTVRDLAVIGNSVWLVGFDNVSKVSPALSDALCQLATGGGYRTRQLYTDAEPFILDIKRPVLLNAIGRVIDRPDLLDRVAMIELAPIAPEKRRTEEEFWGAWEQARPRILGALLDGVAAALASFKEIELEGHPRMADFARWCEAAGEGFGWQPGAFTSAIETGRQELLEGSADAYPEIGVLLAMMEKRSEWSGSASELLKELTAQADEGVAGSRFWPKRPDVLSNRLIQHAPLLRTHGLEVTRGREGGAKRKRFLRIAGRKDARTREDAS
ncbi:MAG: DNA-primase RepB domain-containing protein [Solirubrobacterales bacterium]